MAGNESQLGQLWLLCIRGLGLHSKRCCTDCKLGANCSNSKFCLIKKKYHYFVKIFKKKQASYNSHCINTTDSKLNLIS